MARHIENATRILPGDDTPGKLDFKVYLTEDVDKYDILYVSGSQGAWLKCTRAVNTTLAQTTGMLLMARSKGQSGKFIRAAPIGTIRDVDTSGDTVGDAYYISASAGQVSKTATGFSRRVGYVTKVGTVANNGRILFDGFSQIAAASNILSGTATILSGANSVTITQTTLGGAALGGKPVVATLNTIDGTKSVVAASWTGNNLVITSSANLTADGTVTYMIAVS